MDPVELYQSFRRALRACQLYPQGSRVREEAAERLTARMLDCLEERPEGISIAFLEDGAYVDHNYVAEIEDDGAPLAADLFELGMRELRFLPAVDSSELLRLLEVLVRAKKGELNPVDEDLSILLWESDLSHVSYFLYEDSRWEEEEEAAEEEEDESEKIDSPQAELQEFIDGEIEPSSELPSVVQLSELERLDILSYYRREIEEALPQKYGRLLIEILRVELDASELPRLEQRIIEYLDALLSSERYEILHSLRASLDCEPEAPEAAGPLEHLRVWFERSDLYARAAQLNARHAADREAALMFLEDVPVVALPDLISLMVDPRADAKSDVLDSIRSRIRSGDDAMTLCLADRRPEVRRLALEEVSDPGPQVITLVREILTDPDPDLRARAAAVLGAAGDEAAFKGLAEGIEDPDERVRTASARALAAAKGPRALELLLRSIVAKQFVRRSLEEKRTFFQAAGAVAPEEILPVLARLAEQRGFWPSRERSERSEAALEALGTLGPDAHTFLEDRWKRKRPDLLRRYEKFFGQHHRTQEAA